MASLTLTGFVPTAKKRAILPVSRSIPTPSPDAPTPSRFELDAVAVLADLKQAFHNVLIALNVRRAVELQRLVSVDSRLAWQIHKVATEVDPLTAGSFVPSRASVEKFVANAAKAGVSADRLEPVQLAFDNFEKLVTKHAGDRASFNSLITALRGVSEEFLANDFQNRRTAFRALSSTIGLHVQTQACISIITPAGSHNGYPLYELIMISGLIGLRMLRPIRSVRVHGTRFGDYTGDDAAMPVQSPLGLSDKAEGYLLEEFCSKPIPELEAASGRLTDGRWTTTSILNPEIGNEGAATLMFASRYTNTPFTSHIESAISKPAELLIHDVFLPASILAAGKPSASVHVGNEHPVDSPPDAIPLPGDYRVDHLGRGPDVAATPDIPNYPQILRAVSSKAGRNIDDYELIRFRLEFPLYQSIAKIILAVPPLPPKT